MSTITLKNAKGEGDFLRLRFWGTVLLMLGALLALGAGSVHAAPLAGTAIGNQASASYKDFNSVDRITVSNSVSTIVQAVGSATLTQSQSKIGAPGQTLAFPHTIQNTGNSVATFGVTVGNVTGAGNFNPSPSAASIFADANCDGQADTNSAVTSVGPVTPGGQTCFVVQATISGTAAGGASGTFDVSFTSSIGGSTLTGSPNTDTVTVSANAVINVSKAISVSTGPTGTIVTYQLTYRNTGTISAGNVVIADTLPSGATYVAGSGRWSVATTTPLTDAANDFEGLASPNRIDYGTSGVATGGSVVAILERVDPGVQGVIEFRAIMNGTSSLVNNFANWCYSDIGTGGTVLPAATAAACTAIRGTFGATTLAGVAADIATITGATNTLKTNIVPFTIPAVGVTGVARINDNSSAATDGTNPPDTTTSTGLPDSSVDVAVATAGQGTLATWDTFVWNTTTSSDSYNITVTSSTGAAPNFPAGTTFLLFRSDGFTPLTDSNNDGILDTGPVAGGASYRVRVVAVLPPSGVAGTYDAILQAQSTNTSTSTNTVAVRARIVGSRVDMTNYPGGGGAGQDNGTGGVITTKTANPGSVATFGLTVTNTGSVADSYDLSFNVGSGVYNNTAPFAFTTPGALPSGYSLAFFIDGGSTCSDAQRGAQVSNTGVIAPLGAKNICAMVSIPNGASVATSQIFFRVLSPTTFSGNFTLSSGDVKRDDLTINSYRSVAITPNNSGQVFPGGSIQYCHTVTNGGNVSETLTVTQTAQSLFTASVAGWAQFATAYVDTNKNCILDGTENTAPLTLTVVNAQVYAPGATTNFIVVVQAPSSAAAGQTNANIFTLTGGATTQVATDTTTVVVGQVQLVKDQVLDAPCTVGFVAGTLDAITTFAQTQITTGAIPGACLIYRVRATNVGTQTVTAVTINDVAPPNTTLHAAAVSGATNVCTPGGVDPNVSCTIASLSGGSTTTMYFRVRITP